MVCLRNISVDTLYKGDNEDNNNNNNKFYFSTVIIVCLCPIFNYITVGSSTLIVLTNNINTVINSV